MFVKIFLVFINIFAALVTVLLMAAQNMIAGYAGFFFLVFIFCLFLNFKFFSWQTIILLTVFLAFNTYYGINLSLLPKEHYFHTPWKIIILFLAFPLLVLFLDYLFLIKNQKLKFREVSNDLKGRIFYICTLDLFLIFIFYWIFLRTS